jgi:hypothetical protein
MRWGRVVGLGLIAAVLVLLPAAWWPGVLGQAAKAPPGSGNGSGGKKADESLGSYSLVTTVFEPSEKTHLLNPALTIAVDGGTERAPGEFSGEKPVPAQYTIERLGNPWYECVATVAKLHGCDALDRTDLMIRDPNTIGYHIVSHGGAVTLTVNVEVHDIVPVSHGSGEMPWRARDVVFVAVPKATPVFRFSSEVLVGQWNGEPIVFELGKDLPDSAKKGLEDLGVKQDLGDHVLYSFRVKEPSK